MDCRELVKKCTGDRRCPVESFQQRALADFSPSTPAVLQVFSRRAVGPAIILRPAAVLLSCCEIHTLAMRSNRIFAKHARAASGILKPRSRPDNISATGCRAAEKYTRSRRALVEFSPSTPAALQVFSRREGGPAIILRPAAELLRNTQALDALWQIFRRARPRGFRYSQDAKSARQLFCGRLPSC